MRLHRFYVQQPLGEEVVIDDVSTITQWLKVLRYEQNDSVILFNGDGFEHTFEFVEVSKKLCKLIRKSSQPSIVATTKSYLFLSVIKKDLFELVTEKATELGITDIIPIITDKTGRKNLDFRRLEATIKEASEQSGRGDLAVLHGEMSLVDALKFAKTVAGSAVFTASLHSSTPPSHIKPAPYALFIGPEGGWSEHEEKLFETEDLQSISLGRTVLRAETAAITAIALLQLSC